MEQFSEKIMQALGGWKIADYLGSGQYGKVYEIQRTDFGTVYRAALKIITVPGSEEEIKEIKAAGMNDAEISNYFKSVVEDFVREFALMAKLKGHTNIVGYEDHQVIPADDGIGWTILIRMELLTSLVNYVSEKQMTRRDVIRLGIDLCKALELCQRVNIIHRDIKPANIFVSEMGEYKLGDFGVARIIEHTMSGRTGTDTYMAPEVYYEENYGPSADIYSLGIVMYRLLNGNRAPFLPLAPKPVTYRDNAEAFRRRINGEELPLPNQADGRLAEIVLKACAYRVADRYSSPVAMRKDLEAILYEESEAEAIYPDGDKVSDAEGLSTNGTISLKGYKRKHRAEKKFVENEEHVEDEEPGESRKHAEDREAAEDKEPVENRDSIKTEEAIVHRKFPEDGEYAEEDNTSITKEQTSGDISREENLEKDYFGDDTLMVRRKNRSMQGETLNAEEKTNNAEPEKSEKAENPVEKEVLESAEQKKAEETTSPEKSDREKEPKSKKVEETEEVISEDLQPVEEIEHRDGKRTDRTETKHPKDTKQKKKSFLLIPAAVAVAGISAAVFFSQSSSLAVIPDVCGMTLSEAEGQLQEMGFSAKIQKEYNGEVQADIVISQDKEDGEKERKGSVITLTVSAGAEPVAEETVMTEATVEVPNVLSQKKKAAAAELEELGFTALIEEEYSSSQVNTVISQSIDAGTEAEEGQEITLVVSKKRPQVVGMSVAEALEVLKTEGFSVREIEGKSSSETELNTIADVNYQIAESKEAVLYLNCIQVPDVTQMEKSEAVAALVAAGFTDENISSQEEYDSDVDAGIVSAYQVQEEDWEALADIPEGIELILGEKQVLRGAKISLTVSLGAQPKSSGGTSSGGGSSNYTAPSYTPPAQTQPQPSTPKQDAGVVFSDGDGKVVN